MTRWIQTAAGDSCDRIVSEAEIERLRLEADTIMTRIQTVEEALEQARHEAGDHWDDNELELSLNTPQGKSITVEIDLKADAATNAQTGTNERKSSKPNSNSNRPWLVS